jgi:zinc transporter ZupT
MMVSMFGLFAVGMYLNKSAGGHSHGGPTGEGIVAAAAPPARRSKDLDEDAAVVEARDGNVGEQGAHATALDEKEAAWRLFSDRAGLQQGVAPTRQRNTGGTSDDGGPRDAAALPPAAASEMPPWFGAFYEEYVRHHAGMVDVLADVGSSRTAAVAAFGGHAASEEHAASGHHTALPTPAKVPTARVAPMPGAGAPAPLTDPHTHPGGTRPSTPSSLPSTPPAEGWFVDSENNWTDPHEYRRKSLSIALLEGGILFHSVFVGMTVSLTIDGFVVLLIAILFHQVFEGLGLGARIAAVPYPRGSPRPWLLVVAFGATAPLGQAIGLAARGSYDPNSAVGLIVVGVCNAM